MSHLKLALWASFSNWEPIQDQSDQVYVKFSLFALGRFASRVAFLDLGVKMRNA